MEITPTTDRHTRREHEQFLIDFTDAYRSANDIYLREARCLDVQFPYLLSPMEEGDLFCGRRMKSYVGILPQTEMGLGYFFDRGYYAGNPLCSFWEKECTKSRIDEEYPEELKQAIFTEDYTGIRAAAYRLYRISGTQLDFGQLLQYGLTGLKELMPGSGFHKGARMAIDVIIKTLEWYKKDPRADAQCLERLIKGKPLCFKDALQLVFLYWSMSGSFNFGRMDTYMADFYCDDIDGGVITEAEALELLQGFWCALVPFDQKFDTRITVGGKGRRNEARQNRFAMLAMEATRTVEEIVPQLTLRFYDGQDPRLLDKAYDMLEQGRTFPILYNDDVNVPAVAKAFDVSLEEAERYCPFGCGEYVLFPDSVGTPSGLINLTKILEITLNNGRDIMDDKKLGLDLGHIADYESFGQLMAAYKKQVEYFVSQLAKQEALEYTVTGRQAPLLYCSMLLNDCVRRNRGMLEGGIKHLGGTLESYGNTNAADSLAAIKKLVYDEHTIEKDTLLDLLKKNFKGYEKKRKLLRDAPKYGNDDDFVDRIYYDIHMHLCECAKRQKEHTPLDSYLIVVINNDTNAALGKLTSASADGRLENTYLANANNPYNGADVSGVTAMLNSLLKLPVDVHAGSVQNMKFSKSMFHDNREKVRSLLDTYFKEGGSQAMITVVGRDELENALKEPEKYRNLMVRIGGYSDRFLALNPETQRDVIERTCY